MKTQKVVISSMMAALVCVATMIIRIPAPLNGYINAGDATVILAGFTLSPVCGFFAAGFGSALADVLGGFPLYAPVTFVVKGVMSAAVYFVHKKTPSVNRLPRIIFASILAELIMVVGYMLFEAALYGFVPSLANIPANLIQGGFGVVSGALLVNLFLKKNITF